MALLADVNHPGFQEDLVSNWEPARSLVEKTVSGAKIAPFPLRLLPACLSASSGGWAGLALLWYLLSPLFCELPGSALG